jgi:predicted transcriptional regulator
MLDQKRHLLKLSAQIVAAHVANHSVEIDTLPNMIRSVHTTLANLDLPGTEASVMPKHTPRESKYIGNGNGQTEATHPGNGHNHKNNIYVHPTFGQTVFGDHLICMEDGLSMKMLKRHLLTVHNMTPDEYRAKWELPESYPMVAAEYAKLRSTLALQSGLGLKHEDRPSKLRKGRAAGAW